jgi:hypothetical protein
MATKGTEALRLARQMTGGAETEVDRFEIPLKVWGHSFDEFVLSSPAAAKALFNDGLAKVAMIEAWLGEG